MTITRYRHSATLLPNGQVLVAGGTSVISSVASAELYDPASGLWQATGSMANGRDNHTATLLPNSQVLVAGGYGNTGVALSTVELYDPATGLWTTRQSMTTTRALHTATLLADGRVLVAGGFDKGFFSLASAEFYDPAIGSWTATGSMTTPRLAHSATLLPNGQVLVAGGLATYDAYLASAELYTNDSGGELTLASAASVKRGFAIDLPLTGPSGVEDRSGGPNKKYSVVMTFNQNITSVGGASSTCGSVQSIEIDSSDPRQVNINLVNVAHGCNGSTISVTADSITDDQGNVLDSASVGLGLLLGDVNGDRVVDRHDVNLARQFTHQKTNSTNFRADVSNDGFISASDNQLIHQQLGTSLP